MALNSNSKRVFRLAATYIVLIIFCVIAVYPILQVVTISLRPSDRLLSTSLEIIPENATFDDYVKLFTDQPFLLWLWNSILVSGVVTVTGVVLAAMTGYAFSRFHFIGKKFGLLSLLTTQMFPATMLLLPLYIMLIKLGLINTYFGVIIIYSATALPFT
ncbi:sugar ABC transporter permease, partial [Sphingobacteriales bacterium CHB3]|nr:sugar ABC transporter permease [Sphingobacteriales bacterium CHB3]